LKYPLTVGEVLNRVSVRDTVYTASILGLAYHAYLCYNTLRHTAHQHGKSDREFVSLGSTHAEIPFGFSIGDDD
jgi:hypothetical protein